LSARGEILSHKVIHGGIVNEAAALASLEGALEGAGVGRAELGYLVTTGYGRIMVSFGDKNITEISCHGRGAHHISPGVRTVIDIGGQDSKAIALDGDGGVSNFAMNDKCAAGTGRFLEVMAHALGVPLEEMAELSLRSRHPAQVSSVCTVFAESEIISLVSQGGSTVDIIAGIHEAIGRRMRGMATTISPRAPAMMTGGVAKNQGVVGVLNRRLGIELSVPEEPQIVGALGAALYEARGKPPKTPGKGGWGSAVERDLILPPVSVA
ncbi:MAG: acyl-CoA dehydratase activase, partial [Dehalococcoidia bacterium]|nr:acyl-CoA dehydratase activase [Dehalococcoidia bacterium]